MGWAQGREGGWVGRCDTDRQQRGSDDVYKTNFILNNGESLYRLPPSGRRDTYGSKT